ncbi:unnamed protein product [Cylindrotheca closterium]|uniref:Uncharacterized protein n=1 Tax=Cylindrotheca closterium TaxID=2856 RepID=A0AAD2D031_9STRA|nr:unnamed protein product [Cylindrotheca closterium]
MITPTAGTKTSTSIEPPLESTLDTGSASSSQSKQRQISVSCSTNEEQWQQRQSSEKVSNTAITANTIATQQSTKVTPPPPTSKRIIIPDRHPSTSDHGKRLKVEKSSSADDDDNDNWHLVAAASGQVGQALAKVLMYAVDPIRIQTDLRQNVEAFVIHFRGGKKALLAKQEASTTTTTTAHDGTFHTLPAIIVAGNLKHLDSVVEAISQRPKEYAQTEQDPQELPNRRALLIVIEVQYGLLANGKAGVAVSGDAAHLGFVIHLLKLALKDRKDHSIATSSLSADLALLDSPKKVEKFFKAKRAI